MAFIIIGTTEVPSKRELFGKPSTALNYIDYDFDFEQFLIAQAKISGASPSETPTNDGQLSRQRSVGRNKSDDQRKQRQS